MKVVINLSDEEIKTLEEQMGLPIKNEEDVICLMHALLEVLKDW